MNDKKARNRRRLSLRRFFVPGMPPFVNTICDDLGKNKSALPGSRRAFVACERLSIDYLQISNLWCPEPRLRFGKQAPLGQAGEKSCTSDMCKAKPPSQKTG